MNELFGSHINMYVQENVVMFPTCESNFRFISTYSTHEKITSVHTECVKVAARKNRHMCYII